MADATVLVLGTPSENGPINIVSPGADIADNHLSPVRNINGAYGGGQRRDLRNSLRVLYKTGSFKKRLVLGWASEKCTKGGAFCTIWSAGEG